MHAVGFEGSAAFQEIIFAVKYTGAAVLARTIFHNGIRRLQSIRAGALYFASGLLLTGHAESVVTFFVTTNRRHFKFSGSRVVLDQIHSATARSAGPRCAGTCIGRAARKGRTSASRS